MPTFLWRMCISGVVIDPPCQMHLSLDKKKATNDQGLQQYVKIEAFSSKTFDGIVHWYILIHWKNRKQIVNHDHLDDLSRCASSNAAFAALDQCHIPKIGM
jgi:hypothetical protein